MEELELEELEPGLPPPPDSPEDIGGPVSGIDTSHPGALSEEDDVLVEEARWVILLGVIGFRV